MFQRYLYFAFWLVLSFLFGNQTAHATFSIVACEANTERCGVAVATHNLAVGDGVPFAEAGIGAGVSQLETNPIHAVTIMTVLQEGGSAKDALAEAIKQDGKFLDGNDASARQIGVVSFKGNAAAHTGETAGQYAGHRADGFVSVQGNGLVSKDVLTAMWDCFHNTDGSLDERLLTALEAGYAEGGQTIGVTSAALLVSAPEGWPVDTDLRVDFRQDTAIADLRTAFNANVARQLLFRANRVTGEVDQVEIDRLLEKALELAPGWDRIWLQAGWLAEEAGQTEKAQYRFCRFQKINPAWAEVLNDKIEFSDCTSLP